MIPLLLLQSDEDYLRSLIGYAKHSHDKQTGRLKIGQAMVGVGTTRKDGKLKQKSGRESSTKPRISKRSD